ncbi:hypothetical protein EIP86_010063 [Pleurotus ostreatoroseus]|nr:hypothetical protein EIP86_010063 [Pleurotus ostreatoroseus]
MQAVNVAPLKIVKKNRRKGLVSSVPLVLPPSPPPSPPLFTCTSDSSPISLPQSALAFTAEWDLGQKTFVLTPLDSPSSRTAASPSRINAIPVNVEDDLRPISIALSTPSLYSPSILSRHPDLPVLQHSPSPRSEVPIIDLTIEEDADYSPSCVGTPVSSIFDREPGYSHSRNFSQSTAASSMFELHSMHEKDSEDATTDDAPEGMSLPSGEDADEDGEHLRTDSIRAQIRCVKQGSWRSPRSDAQAYRQETVQEASAQRLRKPLPDLPYIIPSDRFDRVSHFPD